MIKLKSWVECLVIMLPPWYFPIFIFIAYVSLALYHLPAKNWGGVIWLSHLYFLHLLLHILKKFYSPLNLIKYILNRVSIYFTYFSRRKLSGATSLCYTMYAVCLLDHGINLTGMP